jgi:tRNA(Ile)-lysidine synthase
VSAAEPAAPVSAAEAKTLFAGLQSTPALVLAVSGGPDSTALMVLVARWRAALPQGPQLLAVTVDHGLRAESGREAQVAKRLARHLGIRHRTVRWIGPKPESGLQEAARAVRYRLLADAAKSAGARHILTAHTLDDQAETVLLRLARGSGPTGLAAMARETPLTGPAGTGSTRRQSTGRAAASRREGTGSVLIVRPLLDLPKVRLIATLDAGRVAYCDDPSNSDPRFTRARLRGLMPVLAREGLDAERLALLASRLRRAEATIEFAVGVAASAVSDAPWTDGRPILLDAEKFIRLPAEVALRLLGRAIMHAAGEWPLRLGRLEALYDELLASDPARGRHARGRHNRVRRTLAGALITLADERLTIERAPSRSQPAGHGPSGSKPADRTDAAPPYPPGARKTTALRRSAALTTRIYGMRRRPKPL